MGKLGAGGYGEAWVDRLRTGAGAAAAFGIEAGEGGGRRGGRWRPGDFPFANPTDLFQRPAVTKPLALLYYESLVIGNQVLNRLQALGYRVVLAPDLGKLEELVLREKPLVFVAEKDAAVSRVSSAVRLLRSNPATAHVPVLAFADFKDARAQAKLADEARACGANLLADQTGLLTQLPELLDEVLRVD